MCSAGSFPPDRANDVEVVGAGERRVDPPLQADPGRAPLPRLAAADDLLGGDEVRPPAQVRGQLALRERAEAAAEVAHVRVVDVARDDVGDGVAAHLVAERVGGEEDGRQRTAARARKAPPHRPRRAPPLLRPWPGSLRPVVALSARAFPLCAGSALRSQRGGGWWPRLRAGVGGAGRPALATGQPLAVRMPPAAAMRPRGRTSAPASRRTPDRSAAGAPARAPAPGRPLQQSHLRPGSFRVDVIDRHRRDPAPVVDARVQQSRELLEAQVRRRLDVPRRPEHDPRRGGRPEHVGQRRLRRLRHPRPCLRAKFWTITSCTWPKRSPSSRIASSASSRSSRVSPMPSRIPVVKGTARSPAARIVSSRRSGRLSGEP